jgi:predicted nucleic acid-binding protein
LIDSAEVFLDTNVLIYASNGRADEPRKWQIAQRLLTSNFGLSGQVLAEFYHNATRKGKVPLLPDVATRWVGLLTQKPVVAVDGTLVKAGITASQSYKISYWDGAILAAAERLGAKTLYTEDLNHGQKYGSVTVINPFKAN